MQIPTAGYSQKEEICRQNGKQIVTAAEKGHFQRR